MNAGSDDLVHTYFDIDGDLRILESHVDLGFDERKRSEIPEIFVELMHPEKRLGKGTQPIIYPNPVHESVFIDLGGVVNQPVHFDIYDALGQRVYQGELTGETSKLEIPLDSGKYFHEGSYWLRLEGFEEVLPFVKI